MLSFGIEKYRNSAGLGSFAENVFTQEYAKIIWLWRVSKLKTNLFALYKSYLLLKRIKCQKKIM